MELEAHPESIKIKRIKKDTLKLFFVLIIVSSLALS
jgi:hypothetical protein